MESLLKCSHLARATATAGGFLLLLMDDLEEIYSDLGLSCTEFIRRHGNAKVVSLQITTSDVNSITNIVIFILQTARESTPYNQTLLQHHLELV